MGSIWVLSAPCWPHETCYLGCFFQAVSLLDICEQNFDLISSWLSDIYYTITCSNNGWLIGSVVPRHYLDHYWLVVKISSNFHAKNAFENIVQNFDHSFYDLGVLIECSLITRLPWAVIFLTSQCIEISIIRHTAWLMITAWNFQIYGDYIHEFSAESIYSKCILRI